MRKCPESKINKWEKMEIRGKKIIKIREAVPETQYWSNRNCGRKKNLKWQRTRNYQGNNTIKFAISKENGFPAYKGPSVQHNKYATTRNIIMKFQNTIDKERSPKVPKKNNRTLQEAREWEWHLTWQHGKLNDKGAVSFKFCWQFISKSEPSLQPNDKSNVKVE